MSFMIDKLRTTLTKWVGTQIPDVGKVSFSRIKGTLIKDDTAVVDDCNIRGIVHIGKNSVMLGCVVQEGAEVLIGDNCKVVNCEFRKSYTVIGDRCIVSKVTYHTRDISVRIGSDSILHLVDINKSVVAGDRALWVASYVGVGYSVSNGDYVTSEFGTDSLMMRVRLAVRGSITTGNRFTAVLYGVMLHIVLPDSRYDATDELPAYQDESRIFRISCSNLVCGDDVVVTAQMRQNNSASDTIELGDRCRVIWPYETIEADSLGAENVRADADSTIVLQQPHSIRTSRCTLHVGKGAQAVISSALCDRLHFLTNTAVYVKSNTTAIV